ncbi:hypothetical protein ACFQ1Q_04505 [Winogradskyella litorisediminis]|uniref:Uncharacterized protein n=1 Tax=Winogradskyella litorisediminis TaxID=1156618 RepID=A0ABW3N4E5_9FLAO
MKRYKWTEIISLVAFTIITLIALKDGKITMFYLIYLFWIDEFIKTIFDLINFYFNRKNIENPEVYKQLSHSRFFMLFIYLIFILVFFGLMIDWKTEDAVITNFSIIFFKNSLFNLCVFSFLLREVFHFISYKKALNAPAHSIFSKGLITLHVSLILGVFLWAIINGKMGNNPIEFGSYKTIVAIVPFLLIKLIFELLEIKNRFAEIKQTYN